MVADIATGGLVVIDKSAGMTSHDVVARVRRIAGTRKVGHAGTLDPMATGVLVLGMGRATKLLGYVMGHDKTYSATVRLGERTTTDDRDGELTDAIDASAITENQIRGAFEAQVGLISQVPSAVSAIKVQGRRAYDLVRAGEQVDLAAREVRIASIDITGIARGRRADIDIVVRCSAGTYIRAIARDVGSALGVGGHLTALRRTAIGEIDVAAALTLDELADRVESGAGAVVVPLDDAVRRTFRSRELSAQEARELSFGRRIDALGDPDEIVGAIDPQGRAIALVDGHGRAKVVFAPA
ncbi:MAG: tRNA pseudouridine(55) synthase TruB [Cumulibacter sp.]